MDELISRREMMVKAASVATAGAALKMVPGHARAADAGAVSARAIHIEASPPGPRSLSILKRMQRVVGRTNYIGLYGIALGGGDGAYVTDVDGNVYLDCLAGATTNVLGYGNAEVAQTYCRIAMELQNSCFPYSPNVHAVELAEQLLRTVPGVAAKKVLIGLSGSDSVGGAIEAMRKFTGRRAIIKFDNAYHGSTGLSQQASGFRALNEGVYPPSPDFISVGFPVTEQQNEQALARIETLLAGGEVGGIIVEPIQGDAGVQVPYRGFLRRLSELVAQHRALFIVDEIQSGMGRTGKWWAIEHEGVEPDILVTAKGLSGGYAPISALIGRADVIDALGPAQHVFTYTGHPPSAAVAAKVLSIIQKKGIVANASRVGDRLLRNLETIQREVPKVIVGTRGRGLMIGLEVDVSRDPAACKVFATRCVEKGLYVGYFGDAQQVVRIEPPLILTEAQADLVCAVIQVVATEMSTGQIPSTTQEKVRRFAIGL
jgi:4-aminobutyrate aminotransferase-like enzyme